MFSLRNLQLTSTDGIAHFDFTNVIGTSNELLGFCIFPYNSISNGKIMSENGILTIKTNDTDINGNYYVSIFVSF